MKKLIVVLILVMLVSVFNSSLALAKGKKNGWKNGMPYGQWKKKQRQERDWELNNHLKDPFVGAARSLLVPGLGQYYAGDKAGAKKFAAAEFVGISLLMAFEDDQRVKSTLGAGLVGLKLLSAIDAYKKVELYNQGLRKFKPRLSFKDKELDLEITYDF